ncbi:hypothetical protein [Spirosoma validum]|uniref:Uncharacterized protein n=1 Tax=Spirosoma validum TaxID=2771355 RepID=A0A927B2D2_9BACT|nr:hypothetical protein [Spirosoma validum]MBD2754326.1 hypothetical protein [Spirosoma validum]
MKKLILFLFVALTFSACKKGDEDIAPKNPADVVAGRYKLSSFSLQQGSQGISLPGNGVALSGTAELSKTSQDGYVKLLLTVNNNVVFGDADDVQLEVRKTSEAYGLFDGNDQYGDVDGNNIIFSLSGTDGNNQQIALSFVGKK